jgi:hypothetical protein
MRTLKLRTCRRLISELLVRRYESDALSPKMAIAKDKVTTQSTSSGRDTSGTYYAATVWNKRSGKWLAVLHTLVKAQ